MSASELETILKDLPRFGTLIKDRGYRQIWRFEAAGKGYYLKFYPRNASPWKRRLLGSPALREFSRLQWLQKASIPAPRAVATLMGYRLSGQIGDAVILHAIEPAVPLDEYFNRFELAGEEIPDRRDLSLQIRQLVLQLGRAKLGHSDLHLGNFLLAEKKIYLMDAYAVRRGGLRMKQLLQLGHSVMRYATRSDLQRGWELLGGIGPMPTKNPVSKRQWRKFIERDTQDNRYFGRFGAGEWSGAFFRHFKSPWRWSAVSRVDIGEKDWERAWPILLRQIEGDQLQILKRSRSGDVLAGEIVLAGRPFPIIVKRPRRRYWYRYLNEIGRGGRARRAWHKSWHMIVRNIPTAWPMLLMEKRQLGYVADAVIVMERVPGKTLADVDLDVIAPAARDMLFRRVGRILRRIDRLGFAHFDAKASNWIVLDDPRKGPSPVLIDVDGIRRRQWMALGIDRLLRSMREHPQYTPADSLSLCQGYAPFSASLIDNEETEDENDTDAAPPAEKK